jgi:hypothetical protein
VNPISVKIAGEGLLDLAVLSRLAFDAGLSVATQYDLRGKTNLDARLSAFNNAAKFEPWLVARDLDDDSNCPGELVGRLVPRPAPWLCSRIPVRSVESWLMADDCGFAANHKVSPGHVSTRPDALPNAKQAMLELLFVSKSKVIRESMCIKKENGLLRIGPEYNQRLIEFVQFDWDVLRACKNSASLERSVHRIKEFTGRCEQEWGSL